MMDIKHVFDDDEIEKMKETTTNCDLHTTSHLNDKTDQNDTKKTQ